MRLQYVDKKDSAAMLSIKRSSGVTPDVILRNPLHTSEVSAEALKPRSKVGVSVASHKGLMSYKQFLFVKKGTSDNNN